MVRVMKARPVISPGCSAIKTGGERTEFFLPRDFGEFCCGCTRCFKESEPKCPHYKKLQPITAALDEADVIILASPVYVYHATGSMKAFLDHYGWRWMVHRPEEKMFRKQGVCIYNSAPIRESKRLVSFASLFTISVCISLLWKLNGQLLHRKPDFVSKTNDYLDRIRIEN